MDDDELIARLAGGDDVALRVNRSVDSRFSRRPVRSGDADHRPEPRR
jgi:hypothetical protein